MEQHQLTMKIIIFISFVSAAVAFNPYALYDKEIHEEIYNGYQAQKGQIPYICLLIQKSVNNTNSFCGGTIISDSWIVTAAHCCHGMTNTTIYCGLTDTNDGTGVVSVKVNKDSYRIHGSYNTSTLANDIALIQLPTPLPLTSTNLIEAIKIAPTGSVSQYDNDNAETSGWGMSSDGQSGLTNHLQYKDVFITPHSDCQYSYRSVSQVLDSNICVDNYYSPGGPCAGDSGSPVTIVGSDSTTYCVAVVSKGYGLCSDANIVICTYLPYYRSWINQITNLNL